MTEDQVEQWKDFACRMARTCFAESRRPSPEWILDRIEEFFSWNEGELINCVDWDSSVNGTFCCSDLVMDCHHTWNPYYWHSSEYDRAYENFDDHWIGAVRCCLRAGIDMVSEPSAGVLGFTVGHLRKMYPEGVPDFIKSPEGGWKSSSYGQECKPVAEPFDEWDDSTPVVL